METENFQSLLKPLRLELKQGCQDRAMSGGLKNYLRLWVQKHAVDAGLSARLETLAVQYLKFDISQRKQELENLIALLMEETPEKAQSARIPSSGIDPKSEISILPGVGAKRAAAFRQLCILSVEDLLHHFPRDWQDRSHLIPINAAKPGEHATLCGVIRGAANFRARNRMTITEVGVQDKSGVIFAMYFNQPFRQRQFVAGATVVLSGKVERRGSKLQIVNAEAEVLPEGAEQLIHTGRVVPIYPLVKEISQRVLRSAVWASLPSAAGLVDPLSPGLLKKLGLVSLSEALFQIHFPSNEKSRLGARERLVFDEFFTVGLGMALRKASRKKERGAIFKAPGELLKKFEATLPFRLTRAQSRVWREIQNDLAKGDPMQRLLQGDVGSGKTMVAALALAACVENGYQAAMMAPTEILADQHLGNLRRWFEPLGVKVVPLKQGQSAAGKREVLSHLVSGRSLIAVGTSALIQEGVEFGNLGLVVVDEQHRFGVLQRLTLAKKARVRPHVLVMTATPIPRTLAMTAYGDLDVSIIDELPPGRTPVKTLWFQPEQRQAAYDAIRKEINEGRQAFVVYALVEESEKAERRAATQMAEHLQKDIFKEFKIDLLHGRMKPEEKNAVMDRFKAGKIQILCSTTVIEVGVDVPNASVMMVEDADRFGLAQLHQLRGRVGRGAAVSFCYLIGKPMTDDGSRRLAAMVRTTDGFEIAEEDLKLRGPGEILGIRQSGLPDFKIANLVLDQKILIQAKAEAEALVKNDPELKMPEHAELGDLLKRRTQRKLELGEVG